jgi:hypothetical protein
MHVNYEKNIFQRFSSKSDFLNIDQDPEKSSFGKTMWAYIFAAIRAMDFGQCCESGMFIPDPGSRFFFHPGTGIQGSKRFRIPEPDPHQRILVFLTLNTVSKLSEKLYGKFIPDPGSRLFFPSRIRNPGVKKAPDPGYETLTSRL